ncbi:hypothetical protein ACQP2F_33360 [Actinoplanes sp. CA-030573]|uniref:hypothetical protein n=1 Tax=Actinoplanes sp. CA-030573 TaxID=3239898 RepID=UPI003D8B40D1
MHDPKATATEAPADRRTARIEVENFATTLYVLDDTSRSTTRSRKRAKVVWSERDGGTCIDAADRALADLGYQRITDWTNADDQPPSHAIGDRNGWHFATVTLQPTAQS